MSRRDERIANYISDLKEKCAVSADADLLGKVAIGCGRSIYSDDASTVSASDKSELERIKKRFLTGKLGSRTGPNSTAVSRR